MKIVLLVFGKTNESYIAEGIKNYDKRINLYYSFEVEVINEPKNYEKWDIRKKKEEETKSFLSKLNETDEIYLLDEKGIEFSSVEFAKKMQNIMNGSKKRMVFIVGGAYGFSEDFSTKFKNKISLSRMTFTHQMVRLVFVEQIYRAVSIIKGLPYHHE